VIIYSDLINWSILFDRLSNTNAVQELKRLQEEINQISQLPDAELLVVSMESIDWDKIAEEQVWDHMILSDAFSVADNVST